MDKELTITPILINHQPKPSKTSWVKIFMYEPAEADVLATRGQMYAVLSVSSTVPVDFTAIMQLILEELHNKYFQQPEGGILQTLEIALDHIHKRLLLLGQEDKRLSAGFSFHLLTAVNWGTVLYFGQLGSTRASLLRKGVLYDIDEGVAKTAELYLSSGILMPGDRILLGTNQLFDQFARDELKSMLGAPVDQLSSQLEEKLATGADRLMQSAIVLDVDIKQVPTVAEEGLVIKDPDSPDDVPAALPKEKATSLRLEGIKQFPGRLWRWRLFGRLPGLPILIGLAIALLLALSVYWSISQPGQTAGVSDLDPIVRQAEEHYQQAQQLATINPDRASDNITQARELVEQGLQSQPDQATLLQLQQQLQKLENQVNQTADLSNVRQLAEVDLQPTQAKIIVAGQQVYLAGSPSVLTYSLQGDQLELPSPLQQLSDPLIGAAEGRVIAVSGNAVYLSQLDGQLGQPIELRPAVQPKAIDNFRQNAYILDATGQVWRIAAQTATVSGYFQQPIDPGTAGEDGTSLIDMAIDGAVYLLRQQGQVEVYLTGQRQPFELERPSLAATASAILTDESSEHIYLMTGQYISRWSKDGSYAGRWQLPGSATINMAGIDFTAQTLYILADGKLYRADLP